MRYSDWLSLVGMLIFGIAPIWEQRFYGVFLIGVAVFLNSKNKANLK